jgi:hypothetical protein
VVYQTATGRVTLAGLFYRYAALSTDAYTSGKITVSNNRAHDVYSGGNWQNPYSEYQVAAFAPSTDVYAGQYFNIYLTDSLWFSNSKTQVNHIEVNAGDGQGYRTLIPGTPLPKLRRYRLESLAIQTIFERQYNTANPCAS